MMNIQTHTPDNLQNSLQSLSRRALLKNSALLGAAFMVGGTFVAHAKDHWAIETKALKPKTMATLIQLARDIYPHDRIADKYYAIAVKGHDEKAASDADHKTLIENGVNTLNTVARGHKHESYLSIGWEVERTEILLQLQDTAFFQAVRGDLVVSLYNQKAVWPIFGYEGESFSKGGYINRGFDNIDWL